MPFTPHHQAYLGVGFQVNKAIHRLHAGGFQFARQGDVAFFIKTRLQLNNAGHAFAGLSRFNQRLGNRAVARGAIKRLLNRDHIRIARSLPKELHHHIEGFIGVMHHNILGADGGEAIATKIQDAFGKARRIGCEQQIGPVIHDQLRQIGKSKQAIHHKYF